MKANNFQIIVIIIFLAAAVFGVLVFAGIIKIGSEEAKVGPTGTVTLWGTVRSDLMTPLIDDFNNANQTFRVRYVSKSKDTFDQELLEAIASGVGPDLFFLPDNLAYGYANKIYKIPYTSYPVATFKSVFAPAGEVFLTSQGILAFPIMIDPMVMYYNRSILDSNSIIYPPTYWDEFVNMVPLLTKKDESRQITKSAVALGQFSNVTNAKDIVTTLFMQAGNTIVAEKDSYFFPTLREIHERPANLGPILSFYTSFADPLNSYYSWNKALPNSNVAFSADNLAFYFGFASELRDLTNRNPNQNFAVAPMPQIKNSNYKATGARVTGIAISSFSKNPNTAFATASLLTTGDFAAKFANIVGAPPARRDLLFIKPNNTYGPTFYDVALYSRSWLDPSPVDTNNVFRFMVESVLSNTFTTDQAVEDADSKMGLLLLR